MKSNTERDGKEAKLQREAVDRIFAQYGEDYQHYCVTIANQCFESGWQARAEYEKGDAGICETAKAMPMIDENFVKEKINPIVGYLFHSGWQLGNENAPCELDWKYLREGTRQIKELLEQFRPVQPAEDADKPGADAPECESCGSTLIASDPHPVTDGEPLLCVKCVKQEISMGDTKHDPYCDCGICQYCGGDEDVYGNPTTAHKRPDIRAESCRPYQRAARELRRLFPIEIRYNCDFEAFVKRLEKGEL